MDMPARIRTENEDTDSGHARRSEGKISRSAAGPPKAREPDGQIHSVVNATPRGTTEPRFTFIDLFAGVGGLRRGFESIGGECVFTSEWDRHAVETYKANYGEDHPIDTRDIAEVVTSGEIPIHNVLLAGFPCQPFSLAGVSKKNALGRPHGFDDPTQGTLFFQIKRILESHRPEAFLLENVAHLRRHDRGRTWSVIRQTLEDLGYDIHEKVINAKRVLPQNRERIFIVGFREPASFDWSDLDLPGEDHGPRLSQVLHRGDESDVDQRYTDERGRVLP
jgi:DNA (cytosine-5)-methyltransferase 1